MRSASFLCALIFAAPACGSASPATLDYSLAFPSTDAAAATGDVQIFAFSAPAGQTGEEVCLSLFQMRAAAALPQALASTTVTPCDLLAGKGALTLPESANSTQDVALFAVALIGNTDFLTGCFFPEPIANGAMLEPIQLSLVGNQSVPTNIQCAALSDHCNNKC